MTGRILVIQLSESSREKNNFFRSGGIADSKSFILQIFMSPESVATEDQSSTEARVQKVRKFRRRFLKV